MQEDVKYSVIIPVYNRESTLARCLSSLTDQHRNDVQIIIIDDGSCDGSAAIAKDYASAYPYVEYHFQENGGVSQARNTGLTHVLGKYVTFVDSDDYVASDYFHVLDRATEYSEWDLLVFQKQYKDDPSYDETDLFLKLGKLSDSFARLKLLLSSRLIMQPFTKCFRTDIIRKYGLKFAKDFHVGEDFCFCLSYSLFCSSILTVTTSIYCVDISDAHSLSRVYRPDLTSQMTGVFRYVEQKIRNSTFSPEQKDELLSIADYLFVKNICSCIVEGFKAGKLRYFPHRNEIKTICSLFIPPMSEHRSGMVHKLMRKFLDWNWYYPFYAVSFLTKGIPYLSKPER